MTRYALGALFCIAAFGFLATRGYGLVSAVVFIPLFGWYVSRLIVHGGFHLWHYARQGSKEAWNGRHYEFAGTKLRAEETDDELAFLEEDLLGVIEQPKSRTVELFGARERFELSGSGQMALTQAGCERLLAKCPHRDAKKLLLFLQREAFGPYLRRHGRLETRMTQEKKVENTLSVKDVTYRNGDETLKGVLAYDEASKERRPGMIVVHEWWGITKHIRDYVRELAANGYAALAVDMYGNGQTADNPKDAMGLMGDLMGSPKVMKARFEAGRAFLASQAVVDPRRIGALGFCMGGSVVLNMARQGMDLGGVASFHGGLATSNPATPGSVICRVLVLNGAADAFVKPEEIADFKAEMESAKADYRFVDYPGAVHGFTNPEATENGRKFGLPLAYNASADKQSKAEMLKFFSGLFDRR